MDYELQDIYRKGRGVIAKKNFEPGDMVFTCSPAAYVVKTSNLDSVCSGCLGKLSETDDSTNESKNDQSTTKTARFCGEECEALYLRNHESDGFDVSSLRVAELVASVATKHDTDIDLLRIVLRLLTSNEIREHLTHDIPEDTSDRASVLGLLSHAGTTNDRWIETVRIAFDELLQSFHTNAVSYSAHDFLQVRGERLNSQFCVDLALRVNSNAHGLGDLEGTNKDVAFGLFPLVAMINHDCTPNCVFLGMRGGEMMVRTLSLIGVADELCVSYCDLYTSTPSRQDYLMKTKHFACECDRCLQSVALSHDRFIDGIRCQELYLVDDSSDATEQCDGVLLPPGAGSTGSIGQEAMLLTVSLNGANVKDDRLKDPFCAICGSAGSFQSLQVESIKLQASSALQSLEVLVQDGYYEQAKDAYELYLENWSKMIHPNNACIVTARVQLLNVYRTLNMPHKAAVQAGRILRAMTPAFPPNHPEIAAFFFSFAECYFLSYEDLQGTRQQLRGREANETLQLCRTHLKFAKKGIRKAVKMYTGCCGPDHPRTGTALSLQQRIFDSV